VAIAIWYCDTCGETISNPGEAFLQWVVAEDDSIHDVRIVHELSSTPRERPLGCFIDDQQVRREGRGRVQDYGLEAYLGSDGLMYLLSMSEIGFPPKQIYELVRRLHVPGYETVRKHLPRAIERGVIDKNGFDSYYSELQIEKVQAWLESEPQ
jgi:hypothetical protein